MTYKPTPFMRLVKEAARECLSVDAPATGANANPETWCKQAGVSFDKWHEWAQSIEFQTWFFGDLYDRQATVSALDILFHQALTRGMLKPDPNASILRLYAEMRGYIGRNAQASEPGTEKTAAELLAMVDELAGEDPENEKEPD